MARLRSYNTRRKTKAERNRKAWASFRSLLRRNAAELQAGGVIYVAFLAGTLVQFYDPKLIPAGKGIAIMPGFAFDSLLGKIHGKS